MLPTAIVLHGPAREQFTDPAYKRDYDLRVDTSKTSAEDAVAAIRKLVDARSRRSGGA